MPMNLLTKPWKPLVMTRGDLCFFGGEIDGRWRIAVADQSMQLRADPASGEDGLMLLHESQPLQIAAHLVARLGSYAVDFEIDEPESETQESGRYVSCTLETFVKLKEALLGGYLITLKMQPKVARRIVRLLQAMDLLQKIPEDARKELELTAEVRE